MDGALSWNIYHSEWWNVAQLLLMKKILYITVGPIMELHVWLFHWWLYFSLSLLLLFIPVLLLRDYLVPQCTYGVEDVCPVFDTQRIPQLESWARIRAAVNVCTFQRNKCWKPFAIFSSKWYYLKPTLALVVTESLRCQARGGGIFRWVSWNLIYNL